MHEPNSCISCLVKADEPQISSWIEGKEVGQTQDGWLILDEMSIAVQTIPSAFSPPGVSSGFANSAGTRNGTQMAEFAAAASNYHLLEQDPSKKSSTVKWISGCYV